MPTLSLQLDLGDVLLVILFRIGSEQHLDAGDDARGVEPDLGTLSIEAQQGQIRIVLAALVPSRNVAVPQPIDSGAVVIENEVAVNSRKEVASR